ncbi:hypothetical protein AB0B94_31190 [Micromonospora sp. NPDC048986]|uniref:hypothetical protein n=1 Tax=Micromonospora sp. NPDC048986 TaxID=3155644 RepID=UPI0033D1D613
MRLTYFEGFAAALLAQHPNIRRVQTLAEAGITDKPHGLRVDITGGGSVLLQFVRTSPSDGERLDRPDTFDPTSLPPLTLPAPFTGPLRVADLERDLVALIRQAGHPEVAEVETFADWGRSSKPAGVRVRFNDGAVVFVLFWRVLAAGSNRPGADYELPAGV